MKRTVIVVIVVAIAGAYFAGFWPEHRYLSDARDQIRALQERVAAAESRLRVADLLGQLLRFSDAVAAKNYGEAATLSSSFFDGVRAEVSRTDRTDVRSTLQDILNSRDRVTAAIASTDPGLAQVLKGHERALRQALGFPVGGSPQG